MRTRNDFSGTYIILNLVNGNRYYGSSVGVRERLRSHMQTLNRGTHRNQYLQRSWDKYGAKSFLFLPLHPCENQLEAEQMLLDYNWGENGVYNINPLASGSGRSHSEESKEKCRQANLGRKHSPESKLNMSKGQRGKVLSTEARRNMSKAQKGRKVSTTTRQKLSLVMKGRTKGVPKNGQYHITARHEDGRTVAYCGILEGVRLTGLNANNVKGLCQRGHSKGWIVVDKKRITGMQHDFNSR